MNNKQTRVSTSKILDNKIGQYLQKLQSINFTTEEKLLSELNSLLGSFYRTIDGPNFIPVYPLADNAPYAEDYNKNFQAILDDLTIIFNEYENMETVVLGNFNYITSRLNRLNVTLNKTFSKLGDYSLLSTNFTDVLFNGDSFNDTTKIETNSSLYKFPRLSIDTKEGIATLPVNSIKQKKINISQIPVINANSNGIPKASTLTASADIKVLLDGNNDTWFEYEKTTNDGKFLVLDFTVILDKEEIVNHITISPYIDNNISKLVITDITTSNDGKNFLSIQKDIPIADWIAIYEDKFTLTSDGLKANGVYTFTPRKVKFIRFSFTQDIIYNNKFLIGIRDITIEGLPFDSKGEIISTSFSSTDEIKKVVLLSNQNPVEETSLAKIEHFISGDNGLTWNPIRPKTSIGVANTIQTIPELLNFNTIDTNSINTSAPIFNLKYKAYMERMTDAFNKASTSLNQIEIDTTELHIPPNTTPFILSLQQKPITNSISIIETGFGSCGIHNKKYIINTSTNGSPYSGEVATFQLPWTPIPYAMNLPIWNSDHYDKITPQHTSYINEKVYINKELWTRGLKSTSATTDKVYRVDYQKGELTFGNGTNGAAVPTNAVIELMFEKEWIAPSSTGFHEAQLNFSTVKDKAKAKLEYKFPEKPTIDVLNRVYYPSYNDESTFSSLPVDGSMGFQGEAIPYYNKDYTLVKDNKTKISTKYIHPESIKEYVKFGTTSKILSKGTNIFYIGADFDPDINYRCSDTNLINNTSTYRKDISSDCLIPGDYYIDEDNGIIYTYSYSSTSVDTTFTYHSAATIEIPKDKWDYQTSSDGKTNRIIIDPKYWWTSSNTEKEGTETIPSGVYQFQMRYPRVVKDTIKFGSSNFEEEVDYVDGKSEFQKLIQTSEYITLSTKSGHIRKYDLKCSITSDTNNLASFSKTSVFISLKGSEGACTTDGDYYIDRTTRELVVHWASMPSDAGYVTYYFNGDTIDLKKYSVNYPEGRVFTSFPTPSTTIEYQYTHYLMSYPIGRQVESTNYTINENNKTITLKDNETLDRLATTSNSTSPKFYQVSYRYKQDDPNDMPELEPYFTPILKDYTLKLTTKSRLI